MKLNKLMIEIPEKFFNVSYNPKKYPGCGTRDMSDGANCQLFGYELLSHFGLNIPDFRSSDLWDDTKHTDHVNKCDLLPLDILMFNSIYESYGAHVAIFVGDNKAIHLALLEGKPEIWEIEKFLKDHRYKFYIGAKRVKNKFSDS